MPELFTWSDPDFRLLLAVGFFIAVLWVAALVGMSRGNTYAAWRRRRQLRATRRVSPEAEIRAVLDELREVDSALWQARHDNLLGRAPKHARRHIALLTDYRAALVDRLVELDVYSLRPRDKSTGSAAA